MTFKDGTEACITLEITDANQISIVKADNEKSVCKALNDMGVSTQTIDLI